MAFVLNLGIIVNFLYKYTSIEKTSFLLKVIRRRDNEVVVENDILAVCNGSNKRSAKQYTAVYGINFSASELDAFDSIKKQLLFLCNILNIECTNNDSEDLIPLLISRALENTTAKYQGYSDYILQSIYECNSTKLETGYLHWKKYREKLAKTSKEDQIELLKKSFGDGTPLPNNDLSEIQNNTLDNKTIDIKEISKTQFEDIKNQYTRWKKYLETKDNRLAIPLRLIHSGKQICNLYEEVLQNMDKSFFIYGKGGTGKTHLFIELFEKLIDNDASSLVPFYIPLNCVQPNKYKCSIIGELSERLRNPDSGTKLTEQEVDELLRRDDVNILILADGLNEVTQEESRRIIAKEISEIANSNTYKNVRVMLSSRIDHSTWFQSLGITSYFKIEIQDLDEESIKQYLSAELSSVCYSEINIQTKKLLRTAMGLTMYAELVGKNNGKNYYTTLGGLLKAYMCCLLESKDSSLPNEDFLVSVAKEMIDNYSFNISSAELKKIEGYSTSILEAVENVLTTQGTGEKGIIDEYTFSHQNFRDMLVAKSYAEDILNLKKILMTFVR